MKWSDPCFRWSLAVSSQPSIEPVSADDLRLHSRIETNDEDSVLRGYIKAAREMVEADSQRALITQTLTLKMDRFPSDAIELRRCPVQSVSSITYIDTAGDSQTWSSANYVVNTHSEPGRITLAYGQTWPSTYSQENAVTATFIAGYGATELTVKEQARQAIRLLAGHWANNRETVMPGMSTKEIEYSYAALIDRLRWSGYR